MNKKEARKILHETFGNFIQKGNELVFACPSCDHRKRKFSINLDKNAYKCWVCDYRGRNIRRAIRRFGSFLQLKNGTKFSSITIWKNLLTSLWTVSVMNTRLRWRYRKLS